MWISSTPRIPSALQAWAALCIASCAEDRERPAGEGVHPAGWAQEDSPSFHARWLRENGDNLERCRTCHGEDYLGGAVGTSCASAGCHESPGGPEACGTCHGTEDDDPLPGTGAHGKHEVFCELCHEVPEHLGDTGHIDDEGGGPEITFSGLAVQGELTPSFDRATRTCSGTYCHAGGSPAWDETQVPLGCDACHDAPPESHARFERVTVATDGTLLCETCHPVPPGDSHVDGASDLTLPEGCDTCHGDGDLGAPPPALDGAVASDSRGAGAHARHLDPAAPNRVAEPVACESCHAVPTEDDLPAAGHIDTEAPADVTLPPGGVWDPAAASCSVWCHGDRDPGPVWTEDSGDPACDGCHGAPPDDHVAFADVVDRAGCGACHPAPPDEIASHVDGETQLQLANECSTCHGSPDSAAPPVSIDGSILASARGVGAHAKHVASTLGRPVECETCHVVPADVRLEGDGHMDGLPAEVSLPGYDPVVQTCAVSCHGGEERELPVWTDSSTVYCGSCHDTPPAFHLDWNLGDYVQECGNCHVEPPSESHIDGEVTLLP